MGNSPTSGLGQGGSLANSGGSTADDPIDQQLSQIDQIISEFSRYAPKAAVRDESATGGLIPGLKPTDVNDVSDYWNQVQPWIALRNDLQASKFGLVNLPDGTVMPKSSLTPEQQAQVDQANNTRYAQILNQFGLDQFNVMGEATDRANRSAQQDFTNRMDQWDRALGLDKFGFDQASKKLDRWLSLQDQATKDAGLEQDAKKLAVSYGTENGKSDFTGADLGGAVNAMANMAGIPGNEPVIRYPGTQTLDPLGTIDQRARQYGGGGQAPTLEMPAPLATAGNMPSAPSFSGGPAAPALQLPPQLNLGAPAPGLPPWSPTGSNNANPLAGV